MDEQTIITVDSWREEWVKGKVRMALSFGPGAVDVPGYAEATLVLCAVLSAIAAELWPGERKDKARFVELLAQHTPPELRAKTISVPLLEAWLRAQRRESEAQTIQRTFMPYGETRVILGEEVDVPEEDITKACPELTLPEIRACSYAALLYSELRSSYAHEYRPGKKAVSWPMSSRPNQAVSYANQIDAETRKPERLIHFAVAWMGSLAIEAEQRTRTLRPDPNFKDWWISGRKKSAAT
ncbi:MAG: hypothetical protein B7X39_14155 [Lysobacterales bacterium 14-68-21]|jgi:hypothetical protein|nr:MAG: hypothetical protein B7X45_13045 [Xanthomonadales bacterium 15-68-25]OZB65389.1 MAG: hypothetical protein B7X39_14155 [Xanthomonadales bacterium 14-68-21]